MQIRPQVLPVPSLPDRNRAAPSRPSVVEADRDPRRPAVEVVAPAGSDESRRSARAETETERPAAPAGAGRRAGFERTFEPDPRLPRARQQALQAFDEISRLGGDEEKGALVGVDLRV